MKKVLILIPLSWEYVHKNFMWSVMQWALFLKDKYDLGVVDGSSTFMDSTRDKLLEIAETKKKYDYILQLDADQTYPLETLDVLTGHIDAGHKCVTGLTASRQYGWPLAFEFSSIDPPRYKRIRNFDVNAGLVKVDGTGLGGVMIHRSVLDQVPFPRFMMHYDDYLRRPPGDDVMFFVGLKKAGIDCYVDTKLRFGHMVVGERRAEDWVEPSGA